MFEEHNPVYPKMFVPSPIILRVWEGDFGVATVDPECLELMTLFKTNRVDVVIQRAYCPYWVNIPSIRYNNTNVAKDLTTYAIQLCKRTTDAKLDSKLQLGRLLAYKKYFMESFADVFYFDCWLNDINYEHATRVWFSNVIPFPFDYFYLKKMRDKARERFKNVVGARNLDKYFILQHKTAARCLQDFAGLLKADGRRYFFGDFPTTLDVTIYSYLAIALYMPLPDPHLQNLIKSHHVLVKFVRNMTKKYFIDTPIEFKYLEPINVKSDNGATIKTVVIAGLCATTVMLFYAYSIGLIKTQFFKNIEDINF